MGFSFSHHKHLPHYVLQLILLTLSYFCIFSAGINTISANESLGDSEALISNGSRFKLCFFSPPDSSKRYVGIMFNLPVMTVVWVANRNKPLNDSFGAFQISSDGNLVILDGRKEIVWSTNLSGPVENSSVVLLDTGNLVVQDHNSSNEYVWESFKHASDSLLEKMKFARSTPRKESDILKSWTSPVDPAPGRFCMTIEPDGPEVFVLKDGNPYWRTGPWNDQIFTGIPNMESSYHDGIDAGINSLGSAYFIFTLPNSSIFAYYVLNSSGSIERKTWSGDKRRWDVTWTSTSNECEIYGKCGPFGICNAQEMPICSCIQGFMPRSKEEWEAGNWSSGCTRKTQLQCEQNSSTGKLDGFLNLQRVKLPDNFISLHLSEGDCMSACLRNCSCIAYATPVGIGCMHWTRNLIDTQRFTGRSKDVFIRLAYSELDKKHDLRVIIITVVLVFILVAVCTYFLPKLLSSCKAKKHKNRSMILKMKDTVRGYPEDTTVNYDKHGIQFEELPLLKFEMLSNATEKFDRTNKLGQGGFGPVYKGKLPNGQQIAVKRLARSSNQGSEEFMNEVVVISRLQHRNLVRLIGCCVESEEKLLVYEYMPNGSLDAYIFGSHEGKILNWQTCKLVIEGICRGLLYLHRDSRLKIIHRDLKASNILLDEELNPKISDFGMARIFGRKDDQANTTRVVGTYGYMSPEYAHRGIFSEKSDVYSFGILLLEIMSGKKISSFYDEQEQLFLTAYAWKLWNEGRIVDLMDPRKIYDGGVEVVEGDIWRYANVGLLCVQEIAADRPNTSAVLSMLCYEIAELPRPKQPAFFGMQQQSSRAREFQSECSANDVTISRIEGR